MNLDERIDKMLGDGLTVSSKAGKELVRVTTPEKVKQFVEQEVMEARLDEAWTKMFGIPIGPKNKAILLQLITEAKTKPIPEIGAWCLACGHPTLYLEDGLITCAYADCDDPSYTHERLVALAEENHEKKLKGEQHDRS